MKAAVLHGFGTPRFEKIPPPVPQDGEELIEVTAVSPPRSPLRPGSTATT